MHYLKAFLDDQSGATAVEYGVLTAMIAVGLIAAFTLFGENLRGLFGTSETGVGGVLADADTQLD